MKIEVTTEDINIAAEKRNRSPILYISTYDCPISNALNRAAKENGITNIIAHTGRYTIKFLISSHYPITYTSEPIHHDVREFIDGFDEYDVVNPISFEIPDDTFSNLLPVERQILAAKEKDTHNV